MSKSMPDRCMILHFNRQLDDSIECQIEERIYTPEYPDALAKKNQAKEAIADLVDSYIRQFLTTQTK